MKQKQNRSNARDSVYQIRCYSDDKNKAIERAQAEGDTLGYLLACFLAGYAQGLELPEWIKEQHIEKREATL